MNAKTKTAAPKGAAAADADTGNDTDASNTLHDELRAQLTSVTIERDTLAAQLAEAQARLQAAAAPAKSGNEGAGTHVRVCSKSPGGSHRRAGRVWTTAPQDVPLAELNTEQLAQLRSCPLTIVVDL